MTTVTISLQEVEVKIGKATMLCATDDLWADVEVDDDEVSISRIWVGDQNYVRSQDTLDPVEYGWLFTAAEAHVSSRHENLIITAHEQGTVHDYFKAITGKSRLELSQ